MAAASMPTPPDGCRPALPPVRALCRVVRRLHASLAPLPPVVRLVSAFAVSWTIDRACAFPGRLPLLARLRDRERARPMDPEHRRQVLARGLAAAARRGDLATARWLARAYALDRPECVSAAVEAAAAAGHWHVLEWLEAAFASVQLGAREMEVAAGHGRVDVLERLSARLEPVGRGWRRAERVDDLFRCLCAAAVGGHVGVVQSLTLHVSWLERNRGRAAPRELVLPVRKLAANGHLRLLQWAREEEQARLFLTPWAGALWRAALHGHLAVVQWLVEAGVADGDEGAVKAIDKAAGGGHLDVVRWLHGTGRFGISAQAMDAAARHGHLATVRWLHEHWGDADRRGLRALDSAAASGRLELVQFLHERGYESSAAAMDNAAAGGHLAVVAWLAENRVEGCTTEAMDAAAANGHLRVVQWLHDCRAGGCTAKAMDGAAAGGHLDVVQWLHFRRAEGCTIQAMDGAARSGHLRVVQWLHENRREGCSFKAMDGAARAAHFPVLRFLRAHRREGCSKAAFASACANGDLLVLRWLARHYPAQFNRKQLASSHALTKPMRAFLIEEPAAAALAAK